jgi:SAM-dependent methyltransferase
MGKKKRPNIDFEKLLKKGHGCYDAKVGKWWATQARDRAHIKAYTDICCYLERQLDSRGAKAEVIVDYACGDGSFLKRLARHFPKARILGLDGSGLMLKTARSILLKQKIDANFVKTTECFRKDGPRVRLVKTVLPNFKFEEGQADAVIFLFPNLTCSDKERKRYEKNGYNRRRDVCVAEMLCRFREMDPEDEVATVDPDECFDDLMTNKVISRNLRRMLKSGGLLIRSEYANAPRHELTDLTQWRSLFAEGALDLPIKEVRAENIFRFLNSEYHRSAVILDVYHQSGDPTDKEGGYFCSAFEAV